jgi:hypothetical protein
MTAEHQRSLKQPFLIWSRLESVLEGRAGVLLFHACLFCLIGAQPTVMGTIVALAGHPAFIPIAKARGPQPVFLLDRGTAMKWTDEAQAAAEHAHRDTNDDLFEQAIIQAEHLATEVQSSVMGTDY